MYPSSLLIALFSLIYMLNCPILASNGESQKSADTETYHKAATQKDTQAQTKLRDLYMKRQGVFADSNRAFQEYNRRANEGDLIAAVILGWMYADGRGIKQDEKKAVELYVDAAKQGYAMAQHTLGMAYEEGLGVIKDDKSAVKWIQEAANQGYATTQYYLGIFYEEGIGSDKNKKEAAKWYEKAAKQGLAAAQHKLSVMYANGRGVDKDEKEAFKWYFKAARQGHKSIPSIVSLMHKSAQNIGEDGKEKVTRYKIAAKQGDVKAQYKLGWMYANGYGISKNERKAVEWYKQAAEQGYAAAQYELGVMYEVGGRGAGKNAKKAAEWYMKAADQGYAAAKNGLGLLYMDGRGVQKDAQKAAEWFLKAAEQDYENAQFSLGWHYGNGLGVEKNEKEAFKWYWRAARQGDPSAQCNLGWNYSNGQGVEKNEKEAFKWYFKAANLDDATAQCNLGWMYFNGCGVAKDVKEALEWYTKSSKQGYARAQYYLGIIHETDKSKNEPEAIKLYNAIKWYTKAAGQGFANAQHKLGLMYAKGQGVNKNEKTAFGWYKQAAEQGYAAAQHDLAKMYASGYDIGKGDKEAAVWYRKAAEQGYAAAQYCLAEIYAIGRGIGKDDKDAIKWFRMAADQGHAGAQYYLGLMYDEGRGIDKDEKEAIKWYRMAAEQDNPEAQLKLGLKYTEGYGVDRDEKEAVHWFKRAAQRRFIESLPTSKNDNENQSADRYEKKTVEQHHIASVQNNVVIQLKLDKQEEGEQGTDKDLKKATKGYKAAPQGLAEANSLEEQILEDFVEESSHSLLESSMDSVSLDVQVVTKSSPKRPLDKSFSKLSENQIISPAKRQKGNALSLPTENLTILNNTLLFKFESLVLEKDSIKAQLKENSNDYSLHYKLASLYEQISASSSLPQREKQYFEKAIERYKLAADHECQEAQKALCTLRDKGVYSSLDKNAMDWYKKAVTQAGFNFEEFVSTLNTTMSNNNNVTNSRAFPLQLSSISVIDLEDDRYLPTAVEWGGSLSLNHIYSPLYVSKDCRKYEDAIMAVDPSGDGEDETAYCVAKRNGDLYFITALGGFAGGYEKNPKNRMGNSIEVLEKLTDIVIKHKVNYVLIEKNNDNSYASLLRSTLGKDTEIIKWHHSQKKEKRIVETFKPLLDNHQLVIDRKVLKDDFESKPSNDIKYKFFYQLTRMTLDEERWPTKKNALHHDDRLDAAAMAIKHLRVRKEKLKDPEYVHEIVR